MMFYAVLCIYLMVFEFEPVERYVEVVFWVHAVQPCPGSNGGTPVCPSCHQKYPYPFRVVRGPMGQFRGVQTTKSGGLQVEYPPFENGI